MEEKQTKIPCYFFPSAKAIDWECAHILHQIGDKCWVTYSVMVSTYPCFFEDRHAVGTMDKNVFVGLEKAQEERRYRQEQNIPNMISILEARIEALEKKESSHD
ncbi:MAG: hypothetical protein Q4P84_01275 [Elusimicrobiales bacterium]|nr:hypothetical protein [Elusimicrobiales bacterium]